MADEINATTTDSAAPVAAPSSTIKEKKTRGPGKAKAAAKAADVTAVTAPVKKTRVSRKNAGKDSEASVPLVAAAEVSPTKAAAKPQKVTRGPGKEKAIALEADGFADLIKLEEENQKLRKALSEKLRGENADLRKKLGIA
jgi:hypothetical protein